MDTVKTCITCKWHEKIIESHHCRCPDIARVDVVTGDWIEFFCRAERLPAGQYTSCGPEGKFWTAKLKEIPKVVLPCSDCGRIECECLPPTHYAKADAE